MVRSFVVVLAAFVLAACSSSQDTLQRHTVVAHWNGGNATLVVPQSVLKAAFEQEWNDGTTADSVSLLILSEEMYVVGHGKKMGESQVLALPLIRGVPDGDYLYVAPRADTLQTGSIGRWR
jgi:hypothetical protein